MSNTDKQYQANRLAGHVRLSATLWLIISILQIISIDLIIAGVWNLFCAFLSFLREKEVLNRDADIPAQYKGLSVYIITGLINISIGGIVGCFLLIYDFRIRSEILSCKDIFDNTDDNTDFIKPNPSFNYEQLEKLYYLKQKGVLSDEEYEQEKEHLL